MFLLLLSTAIIYLLMKLLTIYYYVVTVLTGIFLYNFLFSIWHTACVEFSVNFAGKQIETNFLDVLHITKPLILYTFVPTSIFKNK